MRTAPLTSVPESLKSVVDDYLLRFPEERSGLSQLLEQIDAGEEGGSLLDRKNMSGHCTSSVLVLNQARTHVLLIHHRAHDLWIPPGGHFEAGCSSLRESAWCEVEQETGLQNLQLLPELGEHLLDIDTHPIPARASKGEGDHWHHDFMYFGIAGADFTPVAQKSEVHAIAWRHLVDLAHDQVPRNRRLYAKAVAALESLAATGAGAFLPEVLPVNNVGDFIIEFARRHGVAAVRTKIDEFAEAVTRLSGDDVKLDHVGQTLIALRERDLISGSQMNKLMFNHLRERKRHTVS